MNNIFEIQLKSIDGGYRVEVSMPQTFNMMLMQNAASPYYGSIHKSHAIRSMASRVAYEFEKELVRLIEIEIDKQEAKPCKS